MHTKCDFVNGTIYNNFIILSKDKRAELTKL